MKRYHDLSLFVTHWTFNLVSAAVLRVSSHHDIFAVTEVFLMCQPLGSRLADPSKQQRTR